MEELLAGPRTWNRSGNGSVVSLQSTSVTSPGQVQRAPVDTGTVLESIGFFIMLLFDLVAVVGNVAVTAVITRAPQLRKFLFVVHLCVIDTMAALTIMPLGIVSSCALFGKVELSDSLCQVYISLGVCLSSASILTISAISIERYYYIVHPMKYEVKMTLGLRASVVVFIWVQAAFTALVPFLVWVAPGNELGTSRSVNATQCSLHRSAGSYSRVFVVVFAVSCFALPLLIITAVYCSVFKVARIAALQHGPVPSWAAARRHRSDSTGSQATIMASSRTQNISADITFGGGKAAFTLILIGGQFLICWSPYFIYHLHAALLDQPVPSELWETTVTWLAYTSFTVNPFFYGCLNTQIRAQLIRVPKCFLKQTLDEQLGLSCHEGSVEENFLQFLQRTSYVADHRHGFSASPRTRIHANQSGLAFRIPGQIPEETPELLALEATEDLRHSKACIKHESYLTPGI